MIENDALKKAGHILALFLWIECTARMIISLRRDSSLLIQLQEEFKSGSIKQTVVNDVVRRWWTNNQKVGFSATLNDFRKYFSSLGDAVIAMEFCWVLRDMLSHMQIAPDGSFFCNLTEHSRERKNKILESLLGKPLELHAAPRVVMDDATYAKLLKELDRFDVEYFPVICKQMGFDYQLIRWPRD